MRRESTSLYPIKSGRVDRILAQSHKLATISLATASPTPFAPGTLHRRVEHDIAASTEAPRDAAPKRDTKMSGKAETDRFRCRRSRTPESAPSLTLAPAKADPVRAREAIPTAAAWNACLLKAMTFTEARAVGRATEALIEVFIIAVCILA